MSSQPAPVESSIEHDRRLQSQFIDLYRERPCLWQPSHKHYKDRMIRLMAYQDLLEVHKQIDPEATVDSVRNKLNTLRTLYNREKKKLLIRRRASSALWYYDKLDSFLGDVITPKVETGTEYTMGTDYEPPTQRSRQTIVTNSIKLEVMPGGKDISYAESYIQEQDIDDTDKNPLEHVSIQMENEDNSSMQVTSHSGIEIPPTEQKNDEFAAFATVVAATLRKLENPQQAIAQKLISDVMFYSKLDKLTEDTTIYIPPK